MAHKPLTHITLLGLILLVLVAMSAPVPAQANGKDGPLYDICENAFMFHGVNQTGGVDHFFTVHAGYHFRHHTTRAGIPSVKYDAWDRPWVYGHSGEEPSLDGWILRGHLCQFPFDPT